MRCTTIIGNPADYIQHQAIKSKHYPGPQCGTKGKRKTVANALIRDRMP
jgi:hypothetical protein